jgi:hypothetical protein
MPITTPLFSSGMTKQSAEELFRDFPQSEVSPCVKPEISARTSLTATMTITLRTWRCVMDWAVNDPADRIEFA